MYLSEDPSLAVPNNLTVQQLLDTVEDMRPELGHLCDVCKKSIRDLLRGGSRESLASQKMLSVVNSAFFFSGAGLHEDSKDQSADEASDNSVGVQEDASFPRLYKPRVMAPEEDPDDDDTHSAILPFTAATTQSIYKVFGTGALHNGNQ